MNKIIEQLPEIKLIGITAITSNEAEMNPDTAKIGETMHKFLLEGLQSKIPNRKNPRKVFAVYTNYESDKNGKYTYFLGEEVTFFENMEEGFEALTIPPQTYTKFTSDPGIIPKVVIDMWQNIWKMEDTSGLDGQRAYLANFEIYDERSMDINCKTLHLT
ncbi:MAG: GyrI-like domain-containing protein [Rickettsia endosymbiont of Argas persicus]